MKTYFLRIVLQLLVWAAALSTYWSHMTAEYWRLLGAAAYFAAFFVLPLLTKKPRTTMVLLCVLSILSVVNLYPLHSEAFNPFLLLIQCMVVWEIIQRLSLFSAIYPAVLQIAGLCLVAVRAGLEPSSWLFISIYVILLYSGAALYRLKHEREAFANARYNTLISEYRSLKRRLATEEDSARQEERMLIGHEIHDSVGHKLTALLMQIESLRLKDGNPYHEEVDLLKQLAYDSLEETRRAVKAFRRGDTGGLQGIMRLIRKLESDSFLRIYFTVNHGAFSAPLHGEQSFAIYRSVQEALTNIMKHSKAREAKILFEAPGGSVFRFEISNPITNPYSYQEGFGLTSMRERLNKINGDLEVFAASGQFVVRGWLQITDRGEPDD
ncbi:sensor histidine kinase [Paenibacillus antibioticophila]|uniref:sensor histidine kinase n=1 Tax=Paenibacillus antibioticophila TaxID=1274374 RepID=UPI0005C93BAF|nr:histidine kinase [Paenibacillus antibioticophila]